MQSFHVTHCEQCGAEIESGQAFCVQCGAPVVSQLQQSAPASAFCVNCGKPLDPGAGFCIHCGQAVENPVPNDAYTGFTEVYNSGAMGTDAFAGAAGVTPASAYCTNCGKPLVPGNAYCIYCAAKVEDSTRSAIPNDNGGSGHNGGFNTDLNGSDSGSVSTIDRNQITTSQKSGGSNKPPVTPVSLVDDDGNIIDDDPFMISQLVEITPEEAQYGCRKNIVTDEGQAITIDVPQRTNAGTEIDVPGYGLYDPASRSRGPLHITFYIVRES